MRAGRAVARQWMAEILSTARNEFPEFPAALSFLPLLTPRATAALLEPRRDSLHRRLSDRDAAIATALADYQLPRVTMLETEYVRAVTEAELRWIDGVLAGINDGSIDWSSEELKAVARQWPSNSLQGR